MTARYKYVKRANHPLSTPSGRIPEHRLLLFEKIGPGEHPCHWGCGAVLNWLPGERTRAGAITTDHVDNDTTNNDQANLVPACHTCNVRRARDARFADTPFLINAQSGVREKATERTCETCTRTFLIATKHLARKNRGRYCSRECMYARHVFDE